MNVPFVDLQIQYQNIKDEIDLAMSSVIQKCDFILGDEVGYFEKDFAEFCSTKHCISVSSGTDALHLSLRVLGIGEGDEVITTSNTFIATALAISFSGAKPVYIDISPETYNIDVSQIESAITENTKAIIPVHLYGQPADMDPICDIAEKYQLKVIEDACQAHGAEYKGQLCGSMGDIGCFSFYPGKNIGAFGDGGAIVTNNPDIAKRFIMFRNYGQQVKYEHTLKGFNNRLDTIQAALLRVKLAYLHKWNQQRYEKAHYYSKLLEDVDVELPVETSETKHVYHLYVIRVKNRDGLRERLSAKKIATGIHYPIPIHLQKCYKYLGYREGDFPITEKYAKELLSLPMFPELSEEQILYVISCIKDFY